MADPRTIHRLSGRDLAALRRAAGLTQTELAQVAGVGRRTVSRLENQAVINPRGWAVGRLTEALGNRVVPTSRATTRASARAGDGVILRDAIDLAKALAREAASHAAIEAAERAHQRVPCAARTRKGHACRMLSEPGRRRCKFHGGRSTGPRTPEGRARIAEAQRQRWAVWRAGRDKRR